MSPQSLLDAASSFFTDLSQNAPPATLLSYFSTTHLIDIQHHPAFSPNNSRLYGSNAVRSYFDLLATHWTRSPVTIHTTDVDTSTNTVTADASITWTWRRSHRRWREDFICTIQFDESLKIISLKVQTVSEPETCVMRAVDPGISDALPVVEKIRERPETECRWDWSHHVWTERWTFPVAEKKR